MNPLEQEIKTIIIEALALEDVAPDDIDPAAPLFGEGLGLDSIDALELGIAIKKKYNVNLSAEDKENRKHFYSVRTLAEFVAAHTS
ncbi:MAG: acyl carrier protein [Spirochaetales bacterium]|nr:acyl carrier protein [Spirochaetales bacterium]